MDLSIIIPTLNEERYIRNTLKKINDHRSGELDLELILIDAGSEDETINQAHGLVDRVHQDQDLRGAKYKSLNKGGEIASGEWLLFLDADSLVPRDFDLLIKNALENPEQVGGAFEFKIDGVGPVYRVMEWINRIRYRVDGKFFGDQGMFCRKSAFDQLKGYPPRPLMEAAYFSKELKRFGKLALIKTHLVTSARRFEEGNVFKVFFKDALIWIQFTLGLSIDRYSRAYWNENEKRR